MLDVSKTYLALRPVVVLQDRLSYHTRAGGFLAPLKVNHYGKVSTVGVADLPLLQPIDFSCSESTFAGAPAAGVARGNTNVEHTISISYLLRTRVDYGLIRSDPATQGVSKLGALEWLARIKDGLELKSDGSGVIDSFMDGTIRKPVSFETQDGESTETAWASILVVSLTVSAIYRGKRTLST